MTKSTNISEVTSRSVRFLGVTSTQFTPTFYVRKKVSQRNQP